MKSGRQICVLGRLRFQRGLFRRSWRRCRGWFGRYDYDACANIAVRRNRRRYIHPAVILWLVGLLAGLYFFVGNGLATQIPRRLLTTFNIAIRESAPRAEFANCGQILHAKRLTMVNSENVAVSDLALNQEQGPIRIGFSQFVSRPQLFRVPQIVGSLSLRREIALIRTTLGNDVSARTQKPMTMGERKATPLAERLNSQMSSGALTTIGEMKNDDWLTFDRARIELGHYTGLRPQINICPLRGFELVARFGQRFIERAPLHQDRRRRNRREEQRSTNYELISFAFADETPRRSLIPAVLLLLAGIGCGMLAVHFGYSGRPLLGIALYLLTICLFATAGIWINYATVPSLPLAYG